MDSLPYVDALVKEYLLFRGFSATLQVGWGGRVEACLLPGVRGFVGALEVCVHGFIGIPTAGMVCRHGGAHRQCLPQPRDRPACLAPVHADVGAYSGP